MSYDSNVEMPSRRDVWTPCDDRTAAAMLGGWLHGCWLLLLLGGRRGRVLVDATGDKAVCTACETSEAPESGCVSPAPVHGIANDSNGMWSLVASAEEAEDDELRCRG
eukprot:COSAG01_NODE_40701_length_460_cov_2.681440_1_plen_107_part_01